MFSLLDITIPLQVSHWTNCLFTLNFLHSSLHFLLTSPMHFLIIFLSICPPLSLIFFSHLPLAKIAYFSPVCAKHTKLICTKTTIKQKNFLDFTQGSCQCTSYSLFRKKNTPNKQRSLVFFLNSCILIYGSF